MFVTGLEVRWSMAEGWVAEYGRTLARLRVEELYKVHKESLGSWMSRLGTEFVTG